MNYTLLSDFCTIYRIPKIQEKLNTLYPNFDQKIPYTWIKMARDTVYSKPLAGPDFWVRLALVGTDDHWKEQCRLQSWLACTKGNSSVILLILAQPRSQPATYASRSSTDLSKLSSEVLRLRLYQLNFPVTGSHARLVGDPGLCFVDSLINISVAPTATYSAYFRGYQHSKSACLFCIISERRLFASIICLSSLWLW